MEQNWATENLQMIRTLMERSALYRRALAPMMFSAGSIGVLGAVVACAFGIRSASSFILYWLAVGALALSVAFLIVRRQAVRDREPVWSGPTRRVAQAMFPPLFAGAAIAILLLFLPLSPEPWVSAWLAPGWMICFGCAAHAAGFSMPRGILVLGWVFILFGLIALGLAFVPSLRQWEPLGHVMMGTSFGGLHLLCGIYLAFTENSRRAP